MERVEDRVRERKIECVCVTERELSSQENICLENEQE